MTNELKEVYFHKYCKACVNYNISENSKPCDECLHNPVNLYSHKPIKFSGTGPVITKPYGYYESINKIKQYLYEVNYKDISYQRAFDYYKMASEDTNFGLCSSVKYGKYYGKNFDWFYNEQAEFLVRTPRINKRYSSIGIASGFSSLTDSFVNSEVYSDLYTILPFQIGDGMNECGVIASMNVVPNDYGKNIAIPKYTSKHMINGQMLVRYILDYFSTAKEAVEYIKDFITIYFSDKLYSMGYEIHYMIADINETYVLEIVNNKTEIIQCSSDGWLWNPFNFKLNKIIPSTNKYFPPILTNFYLYNVKLNYDRTVLTPETKTATDNAMSFNHITPHGSGLERYNYMVYNYKSCNTKNKMIDLMKELKYTRSYITSPNPSTPYWYTEFVGSRGLTVADNIEEFTDVVNIAGDYYLNRNRNDNKTWQTVHSSVYDLKKKKLYLTIQENGEVLTFSLNKENING